VHWELIHALALCLHGRGLGVEETEPVKEGKGRRGTYCFLALFLF
jgi:hypothetical protein